MATVELRGCQQANSASTLELDSWVSHEMVLRHTYLAADHLQGAACRSDDGGEVATFDAFLRIL